MKGNLSRDAIQRSVATTHGHHPAANTAAVVTVAAVEEEIHVVVYILLSYNAAPTNGRLTVVSGSTTLLDQDITSEGLAPLPIEAGIHNGTKNEAMVVTLAAGGSGVIGNLEVLVV